MWNLTPFLRHEISAPGLGVMVISGMKLAEDCPVQRINNDKEKQKKIHIHIQMFGTCCSSSLALP